MGKEHLGDKPSGVQFFLAQSWVTHSESRGFGRVSQGRKVYLVTWMSRGQLLVVCLFAVCTILA